MNEKIEKKIEKIFEDHKISKIPVPVEDIAGFLGIKIKRAPSDDFSGLLLRKDGRALIGVNSNESSSRQRFTIAHELGHFFLHPAKDAFVDYRDNQSGPISRTLKEREANVFASAFLMPKDFLVKDVKKNFTNGIFDEEISTLANKYEVSKEAMTYRLLNLGLFQQK